MKFRLAPYGGLMLAVALLMSVPHAQASASQGHEFDFLLGTWHTNISYLQKTPGGGSHWIHFGGTVTNRVVWDGSGDLEQIEAKGFEGMTLRLYDAPTHQWKLYWADSSDGTLQPAIAGDFNNGTGTFYNFQTIDGRGVFVRQRYFGATPQAYHFEEDTSADGGKTWEPDFRASLTRISTSVLNSAAAPPSAQPLSQHDFDWQFGTWNIAMSRLLHPLTGSTQRARYTGTVKVDKIWNGRGNVAKIDANGSAGALHILALRLYLPQSRQWSLSFAHPGSGDLSDPMYGSFKNGRGAFYDQELYNGKAVLDRFIFSPLTATSARDEESFSQDGGTTWETVWLNDHTLAKHPRS